MTYGFTNIAGVALGRPVTVVPGWKSWPSWAQTLYTFAVGAHVSHALDFSVALLFYLAVWPAALAGAAKGAGAAPAGVLGALGSPGTWLDLSPTGWVARVFAFNIAAEFLLVGFWHQMCVVALAEPALAPPPARALAHVLTASPPARPAPPRPARPAPPRPPCPAPPVGRTAAAWRTRTRPRARSRTTSSTSRCPTAPRPWPAASATCAARCSSRRSAGCRRRRCRWPLRASTRRAPSARSAARTSGRASAARGPRARRCSPRRSRSRRRSGTSRACCLSRTGARSTS